MGLMHNLIIILNDHCIWQKQKYLLYMDWRTILQGCIVDKLFIFKPCLAFLCQPLILEKPQTGLLFSKLMISSCLPKMFMQLHFFPSFFSFFLFESYLQYSNLHTPGSFECQDFQRIPMSTVTFSGIWQCFATVWILEFQALQKWN